jgi:hypothetical protein
MDSTKEVLAMILERLRFMEKTRHDEMASLKAILCVLCTGNPEFLKSYRHHKKIAADQLVHQVSIDEQYDALIKLLRNPGLPGEGEQEKYRRILESFEGPKQ